MSEETVPTGEILREVNTSQGNSGGGGRNEQNPMTRWNGRLNPSNKDKQMSDNKFVKGETGRMNGNMF